MAVGGAFREWDELDFLAAGGMLMVAGGLMALLVPRLRGKGLIFPIAIGAAMMAGAGVGARHGDYDTSGQSEDDAAIAWER